jgi:hypothetical protein
MPMRECVFRIGSDPVSRFPRPWPPGKLHQQHPKWQNKVLSVEAWLRLTAEFSDEELPSVATIQRSMGDILDGGSG